jgi:hypothetical protein
MLLLALIDAMKGNDINFWSNGLLNLGNLSLMIPYQPKI